MAIVLSDEDAVLLCVDKDATPCLLVFFLFPFVALLSSIVAKERTFPRIDLDSCLKDRLGRAEATAGLLQERVSHFSAPYTRSTQ